MADELLSDADVFGGDEQLLSDADVFGAGRRGGTRSEAKPYVGLTEDENARRQFAETDPRRVDIAKSAGQMLEQPNAMDIGGRLQAEREQLSQSPEVIERGRQQALYDARATRAPQEAKPLETTNRLTSDLRESTSNPALRGVVAGAAGLGKVGTGAVRLAADVAGAEDVARFAAGAEGRAGATERGATQDLKGNDKLVADVFASITNSAPSMALGVVGGPAMKALFAQSALSEYGAGRDAGFSVGESASRAGIMGAAEALGERFGFGEQVQLLKSMAKQLPTGELAKVFGAMLTKEIPGEQLTTAMQFMADKFGPAALNPKGSIDQYLEAAGETLKVTIGQSLLMGGGPAAIGAVRNEYQRTDAQRGNPIADFLAPRTKPNAPALPPTQMRTEALRRFDELAAQFGMNPKSVATAKQAASEMPAGEVPGFLGRMTEALQKRGMVSRPIDEQGLAGLSEALDGKPGGDSGKPGGDSSDDAKNAAVDSIEATLKAAGLLDEAITVPGLETATPDAPVEGEKINRNWSSFSPESGTLNIPRSQMPQIAAEHRGALVNFLNARGVSHEMATVDPSELKPTQAEFEPKKVAAIAENPSGRSLLVSADGHILDGHHQWLAARDKGEPVRVVRLDADIQDLLRLAHQFPSSTTATGPRKAANDQSSGMAGQAGSSEGDRRTGGEATAGEVAVDRVSAADGAAGPVGADRGRKAASVDAGAANGKGAVANDQSVVPDPARVAAGPADGGSPAGPRSSGDQRPAAAVDGQLDGAAAAPVPGSGTAGAVGDGGGPDAALSAAQPIADLRKRWPGLADKPDAQVRAAQAWSDAQGRVRAAYEYRGNKDGEIQDALVEEWGQKRIAADQVGYLGELTKRLNAEADRMRALRDTAGTLPNKRQQKQDEERSAQSAEAMRKAIEQDIEFNLERVREMRRQGRINAADEARLLDLARSSKDGFDAAMKLEDFVSGKSVGSGVLPVGRGADASNAAAPVSAQAPAQVAGATEAAAPGASGVRQLGSYGRTPNGATPVELRPNADGTLTPYTGKYPMVDYESGDPISIPADASDAEAVDAIRAAKAIVPKDKFFGIKPSPSAAPAAETATPSTDAEPAESGAAPTEATRDERIAAARTRIDGLKALLACLGKA